MRHKVTVSVLIFSIILLMIFKAEWWIFLILGFVFLGLTSWGAFDVRLNYFLKSFNRKKNCREKIIALTFDDGPTEYTPEFLDILQKYNAKATFFCIGKNVKSNPEIFKKIIAGGHEIANHTYNHSNQNGFLSTKKMMEEIALTDAEFLKFNQRTGLYRPPFGVTNPNIAKAVKILNKKSIGWNVRSLDTVLQNEAKIAQRILKKIEPGSIILMHDTSEKSAKALEILLLNLQPQNYRFVTVSKLLNLD